MSETDSKTMRCLLHFEDLLKDEVGYETWSVSGISITQQNTAKFGSKSLCPLYDSVICTNTSRIWNMNSNRNYEVEFFIYPVAHGGDRYMFQLTTPSSNTSYTFSLRLSLNTEGKIEFACSNWGCSSITGTTVLTVKEWHHIMLRISQQTVKAFIDGVEDISVNLPENITLKPTQARVGYFNNRSYPYYLDEFVFRHSAGTDTPTIPTSPFSYCYHRHSIRNFGTIKSLIHFDYPYFNEPNDGLDDEVGLETWRRENSNVKLYGSAIPNEGKFPPKFGYRCLYSYAGAVIGTNTSGVWNMNSSGDYEIEFFVNYKTNGTSTKYLFRLMSEANPILAISINNDGNVELTATGWGIDTALLGTHSIVGTSSYDWYNWMHVLIRVSGRKLKVYLAPWWETYGQEDISADLPENVTLSVSEVRLGYFSSASYPFYIDEFCFRHSAGNGEPVAPTKPYSGALDVNSVGGYGTGQDREKVIREDIQINSYGAIDTVTDSKTFTVKEWNDGDCKPLAGTEVMIHITRPISTTIAPYPEVGLYAFSRIAEINGTSVVLTDKITFTEDNGYDFALSEELLDVYYIQVITVPNYQLLAVSRDATIRPLSWSGGTGGGIVAFRVKGHCIVNGRILVHGYGAIRYDLHQMTHPKLIDRFLCSQGGGIFITCGGTLNIGWNARLGANYYVTAGYGGKGETVNYYYQQTKNYVIGSGGSGGVGGGGGGGTACKYGGQTANGGNAGSSGGTGTHAGGGGGGCMGSGGSGGFASGGKGGSQGVNVNGYGGGSRDYQPSGQDPDTAYGGNGGGAPGGNGGGNGGIAGASIALLCECLNAYSGSSISTGGEGLGTTQREGGSYGARGGGGTGFCYIACGKEIGE